jgi:hypothetical protein
LYPSKNMNAERDMQSQFLAAAAVLTLAAIAGASAVVTYASAQTPWGPTAPSGNDRTSAPAYAPPNHEYDYPGYQTYGSVSSSRGYAYGLDNQSNGQAYCIRRFRSYDPGTGTYLGYDGVRHLCP